MRLTEEAERYIEDFISNVEDTDISSLDGERSDASSSIGGLIKPETFNSLPVTVPRSLPVLMDGVALPWLQWETGNDASPMTSLNKARMAVTPKTSSSTQVITVLSNYFLIKCLRLDNLWKKHDRMKIICCIFTCDFHIFHHLALIYCKRIALENWYNSFNHLHRHFLWTITHICCKIWSYRIAKLNSRDRKDIIKNGH